MIAESTDVEKILRLSELEAMIRRAKSDDYVRVGDALAEIRDGKLAELAGFESFERWCAGLTGLDPKRYLWAAEVARNVHPAQPAFTQALYMHRLTPSEQRELVARIEADRGLARTSAKELRAMVLPMLSDKPVPTPRDLQLPTLTTKELWACQVRKDFDKQLVRLIRMFEKSNPKIGVISVAERDSEGRCLAVAIMAKEPAL